MWLTFWATLQAYILKRKKQDETTGFQYSGDSNFCCTVIAI